MTTTALSLLILLMATAFSWSSAEGARVLQVKGPSQSSSSPLAAAEMAAGSADQPNRLLKRRYLAAAQKTSEPDMDQPPPAGRAEPETALLRRRRGEPPAEVTELMSMDYTPVHRKPPINNNLPYLPAHLP